MVTGILIKNAGSWWVASPTRHITVTAPTAHAVVKMLSNLKAAGEF